MPIPKTVSLVSEMINFLGFSSTKITTTVNNQHSNNHKLLSLFWGENLTPIKLLNLTGGGDNLAENCFVLRDLIPINIFK